MELGVSLSRNVPCSSEFNTEHLTSELSHEDNGDSDCDFVSQEGHGLKRRASSAKKDVNLNAAKWRTDVENSEAESAILSSLPQSFCNVIQQCNAAESTTTIRANCLNEDEFALWLDEYKSNTHTNWISDHTFPNAICQAFKKKFVCQFSSRNKGPNKAHYRSRDKSCKASLSVSIKKIT